jgi:uncharacterized protein (DUF305 family)
MKQKMKANLLLIPTLLTLAFATTPSTKAEAPAPHTSQANYEVRFLTDMIDHHHMAVMMGMMCEDRAVHEELKDLCHEIVAAQTSEIEQMQAWLQDWYGITHEPEMKKKDQRMMDQLASLSGEEFEIEFMTMMIRHHEKAVREGMHCVDRAYHPDLIELCENIVQTQTEEIMLMEQWLCEWYDICQ